MEKAEVLERLARECPVPEPGQEVEVDRFRPVDAWGVARLFFTVYGGEYPAEIPYVPERLVGANGDGTMYSAVARTPTGDVIGHVALYRSSPPHPGLYELGQGAVLPAYRGASLVTKLQSLLLEEVTPGLPVDAVFGEVVMHHTAMQKLVARLGCMETGIELDLMPEGSYEREGEPGRVSVLLVSRTYRDRPQLLHVPPVHRPALELVLPDLGILRTVEDSVAPLPRGRKTEVSVTTFPPAGVLRANVASAGEDFEEVCRNIEARADGEGLVVRQLFLSLHEPWTGAAVDILGAHGYFLAGYAPRWFDHDALVLQKLTVEPGWDRMKVFADKAQRILELIRRDRERVRGLP